MQYQAFAFNEGKARQAKRLLQMMELEVRSQSSLHPS